MFTLTAETGREAQRKIAEAALTKGREVSPRGFKTRELRPGVITITNPRDTLPTGIGRDKLNPAIGAAEALQLIAGVSYPDLMVRIASKFEDFINPETRKFDGAYGPRVGEQILHVVERLRNDPDTRQAIAVIYAPEDTHSRPRSLDYPCTLNLHFIVRNGALCLHVNMRSNDIWLGWPYDLFQFTQLQCSVANALGLPVGNYVHVANSLHLYEHNFEAAGKLHFGQQLEDFHAHSLNGIGRAGDGLHEIAHRADMILQGKPFGEATPTERWYMKVLAPYLVKADCGS